MGDLKWGAEFDESNRQWQTSFDRGILESDRNYNRDVFESDRNYDYTLDRDEIEDGWRNEEWDYNVSQTNSNTAYGKVYDMLMNGVMPSDDLLEAAGVSQAEAAAWYTSRQQENDGGGGGGIEPVKPREGDYEPITGVDPDVDPNGGLTKSQIEKIQKHFGAKVDGAWGPETAQKSGANSPAEAWAAYLKAAGKNADFSDRHSAAVADAPDRTSADTSDLSSKGKSALSSLSTMYDSISNQYRGSDGLFPVEKSILAMAAEGRITEDDGYILMQHFGYNGDKHFPEG